MGWASRALSRRTFRFARNPGTLGARHYGARHSLRASSGLVPSDALASQRAPQTPQRERPCCFYVSARITRETRNQGMRLEATRRELRQTASTSDRHGPAAEESAVDVSWRPSARPILQELPPCASCRRFTHESFLNSQSQRRNCRIRATRRRSFHACHAAAPHCLT